MGEPCINIVVRVPQRHDCAWPDYQQHWSIKCEIMSMVAIAITDECSALTPLQIHAITEKLVAVVGGGEDGVNHASPTACNVPPTA